MRCPACNVLSQENSAACENCGLLLIVAAKPTKRRRDDLSQERRRAADQSKIACPFCKSELESSAVRCAHCSSIVSEEYRAKRRQRLRTQVNYASWVAYIFGLITFLLFKPVGMLSIAIGLLLAIVYYAIPVDPTSSSDGSYWNRLKTTLKAQMKLERISIPFPHLPSKRLVLVGTPVVAAFVGYLANFFLLQQPVNQILKGNQAFRGMSVSAHYEYWIIPGVVVYDLKTIQKQTPLDVYTAFLEFADDKKESEIRKIKLLYQGSEKFSIEGGDFRKLGREYSRRNFAWVLFEFPRILRANESPKVNSGQREALIEFYNHWYLSEAPQTGS